jgi:acyl-coenzyme A thioesterase PaaI-like protein
MRQIIDNLASTSADVDELSEAAAALEDLAARFEAMPTGQVYEGFAEAANAGVAITDDPERLALFDHSPLIGLSNPLSPPLTMHHDPDNPDQILANVTFGPAFEGPPGCVHGGYVAAVFDEVLGAAQSLSGTEGMTAHLEVDYRTPTPLGRRLDIRGWVISREGRKIWAGAEIHAGDRLCAESRALFLGFREGSFAKMLAERDA